MSDDLRDVLPVLAPPPGGQRRLLARVRARRTVAPRLAVFATAMATAAAVLVGALASLERQPRASPLHAVDRDPVMLALADDTAAVRAIGGQVAAPVAVDGHAVLYYRVFATGASP